MRVAVDAIGGLARRDILWYLPDRAMKGRSWGRR
jgi:hypothetical protein